MAPFIPTDDERFVLESQVRDAFGRAAYTHKTHEKMAERLHVDFERLSWAQIVLAALTAGGAVGALFTKDTSCFAIGTAVLSVATLAANFYKKDLDPGGLAQKHRSVAADVWNVREAYLSLLTDIRDSSITMKDLRTRRDKLQADLYKIYKGAPSTDGDAYGEAQDALKNKEDLTFSDAEIDAFLPGPLKRVRTTPTPDKSNDGSSA